MNPPNAMIRHERSAPRLPLGRIVAAGTTLLVVYFALRGFHGVAQSLLLGFFGVLLATLALVGLWAGATVLVAPRVATQLAQLAHAVPRGVARAGELWARIAPPAAGSWVAARDRIVAALPSLATRMVPFVNGTVSAVSGTLIVFAVGLFFAIDPHAELAGAARLVPPRREALYWTLVTRLGATLRRWLVGTIVTQAIVATLTGVGLLVLRVPSWLALALVTFATGFVPYVGSAFSGLLVLGAGLAVSPRVGLAAIVVFIVGQALHSVVIAPLVFRRTVQIPPALLLLSEIVMGASFGVLGIIAAHPLLAAALAVIEVVYVEGRLGRTPRA